MALQKLSIKNVDFNNKRVLLRCDLNVPMKDGKITNTLRIDSSIPTIKYLLEQGASSVAILSHFGRPENIKLEDADKKYSLAPVAECLSEKLGRSVTFVNQCVGEEAEEAVKQGGVILLENVRFHIEEEGKRKNAAGETVKATPENITAFRQDLRKLGDVYVNDAFGTSHRLHSSMIGEGFEVRCAGFLVDKELEAFSKVIENPERPFLAIMGGAKISDKILLVENMLSKVDKMIICGGMAFTFLKVMENMSIGNSLYDAEGAKLVPKLVELAKEKGVELILPVDFRIIKEWKGPVQKIVTREEGIPEGFEAIDCGSETQKIFAEAILSCKTVVNNGPAGAADVKEDYANGTRAVIDAMSKATNEGSFCVIGGGDSASIAQAMGAKVSFISTGGGASLELLQNDTLPAVEKLCNA